jgi:hypothetical protein
VIGSRGVTAARSVTRCAYRAVAGPFSTSEIDVTGGAGSVPASEVSAGRQ